MGKVYTRNTHATASVVFNRRRAMRPCNTVPDGAPSPLGGGTTAVITSGPAWAAAARGAYDRGERFSELLSGGGVRSARSSPRRRVVVVVGRCCQPSARV